MDARMSIESRRSTNVDTDDDYLLSDSLEYTEDSLATTDQQVAQMNEFDQFSVHTMCPHCQRETETKLNHHAGSATFKCFALLMILTCGLLSWLPFVLKDFKDVDHTCQHCGKIIATYKRKFISR